MKWHTGLPEKAIEAACGDLRNAGIDGVRIELLEALMEKTTLSLGFAEESAFAAVFLLGAMILKEVRRR